MKLYAVNPFKKTSDYVEVDENNQLEQFYKIIDCNLVEYHSFELDGVSFDVICDEEFMLYNQDLIPTVIAMKNGHPVGILYGTIIIAKHDGEGNTVGLTDADMGILRLHLGYLFTSDDDTDIYPVLNIENY